MTAEPLKSASPTLADGLAVTVTQAYAEAETTILATITLNVRAALAADSPGTALQGRAGPVQTAARRAVDKAERGARRAVPHALSEAYGRGHGLERKTTEQAVRSVLGRLADLRNGILRWVADLWNRILAAVYVHPEPLPAVDRLLQRDAGRGVTVLDFTGRRTRVVSLVDQTVQHAAGGAAIDGFLTRTTQDGGDLVIVTESAHPCPLCNPWEHRVLSVSGHDPARPSMTQARSAGLFHPNCHHTIVRWAPGFVWPPNSTENLPGSYEAVQRQRDIERHIRTWKRRQAAALDDLTKARAGRYVRKWQAELRNHLAAEGLRRSRQRERTDYGHTRPLRHAHGG